MLELMKCVHNKLLKTNEQFAEYLGVIWVFVRTSGATENHNRLLTILWADKQW